MTPSKKSRTGLILTAVAYSVLCMMYFMPAQIPHKISFPLLLLSVVSIWLVPWQMYLAMAFSCLGDFLGSMHCFEGQMASFALAHIFMVAFFTWRYACNAGKEFFTLYNLAVMAAVLCIAAFSFLKVTPEVPHGFLRVGVSIYCTVISAMLFTALLQRNPLIAAGAILFVCSDMVLGWNRFVSPVEGSRYLIMIPYYLGQLMLFLGVQIHGSNGKVFCSSSIER